MTETLPIFDDRPGGGSSHPVFSSRASRSGLPDLQERGRFLAAPEVIRGMSDYTSDYTARTANLAPLLLAGVSGRS